MFSYNGKEYELKFTLERIELVENYLKMSQDLPFLFQGA